MNILGININEYNNDKVLNKVEDILNRDYQKYIVTPNPEIILKAQNNEELFYILNNSAISIADGVGIKIAGWLMGINIPRITGADLTSNILKLAEEKKLFVTIVIQASGLSSKKDVSKTLVKQYSKLKYEIVIYKKEKQIIFKKEPDILISALGAPIQERLNFHTLKNNKNIRLAIGVGGSIDYLTKKAIRAPKTMRLLGLEWLWRLVLYPKRYKRIFNATIVFPLEFIKWRFILPFLYRKNVACILFRKNTKLNEYEILITERRNEPGMWQLPQGGTDGENLIKAGTRELTEEIGTNKFTAINAFQSIHKYKFGSNLAKNIQYGYKGQQQGLFIAEFNGVESDINICQYEHQDYKWVLTKDIIENVEKIRRPSTQKFLDIFLNTIN